MEPVHARLRGRGKYCSWAADHPHVGGPRDGLRYRLARQGFHYEPHSGGGVCGASSAGLISMTGWNRSMLDFEGGVNIALGLPIIRTSVDHGTAFDIAWQGKASTTSLIRAVEFAERLARA